jgi:hypothetical protein
MIFAYEFKDVIEYSKNENIYWLSVLHYYEIISPTFIPKTIYGPYKYKIIINFIIFRIYIYGLKFFRSIFSHKIKIYHDYFIAINLLKDDGPLFHLQPTFHGKYTLGLSS